ncbi:MAG: hypothetical protein R3265_06100 [Hyphomonas sp.]|nr:hypothetical protein [Hyphomonas sp.]
MQGIFDFLFSNVTLTGLTASVLFGAVVVFFEFRKLTERVDEVVSFQRKIAAKLEELESKFNSADRF